MISSFEAEMQELYAHRIGNKFNDEYLSLSDYPVNIEDDLFKAIMMNYFLKPFEKVHQVYSFFHPSNDVGLNTVYNHTKNCFDDNRFLLEVSECITRHLYDVSNHPKIKSGEVYVALFNNVQIEGELHQALGIFKSENKETYLKINPELAINYEQDGINIQKLDKGCLIFNTEADKGYKVAVIDNSKEGYWKDDFLQLIVRNDEFNQTSNIIGLVKNFFTDKIDENFEISKSDRVDLLNKSVKYFKEKEVFDTEEFTEEVIGNETASQLFKDYKQDFEDSYEQPIPENFNISSEAVKSKSRTFKNVIQLDKNFSLHVHGSKDLIEKGFDEEKGLSFYKLYFKDEK